MKLSALVIAFLSTTQVYSSVLKSDAAAINEKLTIDFTKSELMDLKTNQIKNDLKNKMESVAVDHASKISGKMTGISLALNPLADNKNYSYFFTFNVDGVKDSAGQKNCMAIVDKAFSKYSASCYHVVK